MATTTSKKTERRKKASDKKAGPKPAQPAAPSAGSPPAVPPVLKGARVSPATRSKIGNHSAAAKSKAAEASTSHNEVHRVREALGVSRNVFARMTGFSERSIIGWELGHNAVSEAGLRRVKEMDRLRRALAEVMKPSFLPTWLTRPCEELGNLKPVEILERGELDRLWRLVFLLGSGMPT